MKIGVAGMAAHAASAWHGEKHHHLSMARSMAKSISGGDINGGGGGGINGKLSVSAASARQWQ